MTDGNLAYNQRLQEIFARSNLADLPAMSSNVRELLALTHSKRSAAKDLAEVILRDYALTNKILRVVNSAYYAPKQPINSVLRAVTVIGFEAVREIAVTVTIFEDFIKMGADKEEMSKLLTKSLLSALVAKTICFARQIKVGPEEAFICALLHTLGKIVVLVYLPERFRAIEQRQQAGLSSEAASREVLDGLSYQEVGEELSKVWNLSPNITAAMTPFPPVPQHAHDQKAYLQNVAALSNGLVEAVCCQAPLANILKGFDDPLALAPKDARILLGRCLERAEDFSGTVRYGLTKLKFRSCLEKYSGSERGVS